MKKNQIKRSPALLLLAFMLANFLQAQENYQAGYILTASNDTVKGYIDYRNWEKNPDKIRFKRTPEEQPEIYRPLDIKEFGVSNEIYVSAIVETENTSLATNELIRDSQLKIKTDTAFLQTLYNGKKSLYYLKNWAGRENFYIYRENKLELLIHKKYLKWNEGHQIIIKNKAYIGQLKLYLDNCSSISSKLESTAYNLKSLYRLFDNYYKCIPAESNYQWQKQKAKFEFSLLAGISSTTINFSGKPYKEFVNTDFGYNTNFSGGVSLQIVLPRNLNKFSLNGEIIYSEYGFSGTYLDYVNEGYYTDISYEFDFSYLNLNLLLRYSFPIGKLHSFVNGGVSSGFVVKEKNYRYEELFSYGSVYPDEGKALDDIRRNEQLLIMGTGAKLNKYSFEFRYAMGNGFSGYVNLSSKTSVFFVLFGYQL